MFRRYCDHLFPYASLCMAVLVLADAATPLVFGAYGVMVALLCAAHWPQR